MYDIIIPKEWGIALKDKLKTYIHRGDSVNVWGLPNIGRTGQFEYLREEIGEEIRCTVVDSKFLTEVTSENFFTLLNAGLEQIISSETKVDPGKTPLVNSMNLIKEIVKEHNLCILLDSIEELVPLNSKFFTTFKSIRDQFMGKLSFIFSSERPLHEHRILKDNREFLDFAGHNQIIAQPYTEEEVLKMLSVFVSSYDLKLSESQRKVIPKMCGGILGILKSIVRAVDSKPDVEFKDSVLVHDHSISNRLELIYQSFTPDEIRYLYSQTKTDLKSANPNTDYLNKSGILDSKGRIRSSLFETYVSKKKAASPSTSDSGTQKKPQTATVNASENGLRIDFRSGEIFRNGKRLSTLLSEEETKIVKFMSENKEGIISRDQIAKVVWEDKYLEKYSDWAIDKTISRIRSKIGDSKRPYKNLITIKGRGFKLYL